MEGEGCELRRLMPTEISERINADMERVQRDIFENGGVRVWRNDGVDLLLSSPDNDVMIVFTHFLQHFFVVLIPDDTRSVFR